MVCKQTITGRMLQQICKLTITGRMQQKITEGDMDVCSNYWGYVYKQTVTGGVINKQFTGRMQHDM